MTSTTPAASSQQSAEETALPRSMYRATLTLLDGDKITLDVPLAVMVHDKVTSNVSSTVLLGNVKTVNATSPTSYRSSEGVKDKYKSKPAVSMYVKSHYQHLKVHRVNI